MPDELLDIVNDEDIVTGQEMRSTVHELGLQVKPGKHRLTIRVDNRMKINVGPWASGITEEGPGNWNGITGRIELRATADEIVGPAPDGFHRPFHRLSIGGSPGQDNNLSLGPALFEIREEIKAVGVGQLDIEQD